MLDEYTVEPDIDSPDLTALKRRTDVATLLGCGNEAGRPFQTSVTISAPLLSAVLASALGG